MKSLSFLLFGLYFLLLSHSSLGQTKTVDFDKLKNVKEYGVQVNSTADQTDLIQRVIDEAMEGETVFFPEGVYYVRTLKLKSGVNIFSKGTLTHHADAKIGAYSIEKQNSPNPLILGEKVENLSISIRAISKNEGIFLLKSHQIRIVDSDIKGDSTKFRSFPGIIAFESSQIEIANSRIRNFGKPRTQQDLYHPGTGIRILSCNTISIHHSEISNNGENGIFIYGSRKVEVINNVIHHNGMSGIQVAFSTKGKERDYVLSNNILDSNAADAIDVNNRTHENIMDIESVIADNLSCDNGYVNGQSTADGSGIGTFINVSNVFLFRNQAYRNNRPALYVESCGLIVAKENWADNEVEVVLDLENLRLEKNRFSSVNLIANVEAKQISLINNEFRSLSLPNGIQVKEFIIEGNRFSHATFNFNFEGRLSMRKNHLKNASTIPAILVVKADSALIENNEIESLQSSAIVLTNTAVSVQIVSNRIEAYSPVIFDESSRDLSIRANTLRSLIGGKEQLTFRSHYPRNLHMSGNTHIGKDGDDVVLFVGKGNALVEEENLLSGVSNYGKVILSTTSN